MVIEKMEVTSCKSVAEIEKLCFSTPWSKASLENEFNLSYAHYFCVKEQNQVVAYVGVHNICQEGEITTFAVHPAHRRKGFGYRLLKELISYEKKQGIKLLNLEVRQGNIPAVSLYEGLGFEKVGVRKGYYQNPTEDGILMTLHL